MDRPFNWAASLATIAIVAGCKSTPASHAAAEGGTGNEATTKTGGTHSGGNTSSAKTSAHSGGTSAGVTHTGGTNAGGTNAGGTNAGGTNAGGTNAGGTNAGGTNAGGTNAGGTNAGGFTFGSTTGTGGTPAVVTPTAQSVTAAVVGIHGDDLTVTVKGTQGKVGDLLAMEVTLLDTSSQSITFFDTDLDGTPDPGAGSLVLDSTPTTTTFTGSGTIPKAGRLGSLSKVSVKLISVSGGTSNAVTATVTQQTVVTDGATCDPKGITNRCADGMGCTGASPKCSTSVVPTIEKSTYVSTSTGGAVIVAGSDMASPLTSVYVEFFDNLGQPKGFDTTGGGNLDTSLTSLNGITNASGSFVWSIKPETNFVSAIPRLKLTPTDEASKSGAQVTVDLAPIPVKSPGAICDTRGFDACPIGSLCWPGTTVTAGTCQTITSKQTASCSTATVLTVGAGSARIAGRFNTVNLWSPPDGCSTPNSLTAPDAVVHLKTTATIPTLLLSTKTAETNVATVVYLLDSCGGTATTDQCTDRSQDGKSAAAELKLTNVAAGDYYVIIENLDYRSGSYGLVATAQ
jgi:hypothetical protein